MTIRLMDTNDRPFILCTSQLGIIIIERKIICFINIEILYSVSICLYKSPRKFEFHWHTKQKRCWRKTHFSVASLDDWAKKRNEKRNPIRRRYIYKNIHMVHSNLGKRQISYKFSLFYLFWILKRHKEQRQQQILIQIFTRIPPSFDLQNSAEESTILENYNNNNTSV